MIGNNAESGPRVCHQLVVALPPLVAPSDKLKESYFVDLGKILKEYFFSGLIKENKRVEVSKRYVIKIKWNMNFKMGALNRYYRIY